MKKIFIHIGPHKTGTTTIQRCLLLNRERLMKNGIYYPLIGHQIKKKFLESDHISQIIQDEHIGNRNLAYEINYDLRFSKEFGTWADLIQDIEKSEFNKGIISSEELCSIPTEKILKIKKYLCDYETFIVIYLRRQDKWMQSFWTQKIKSNYHLEFFTDFNKWIKNIDYYHPFCDYYMLINKWAAHFGIENILIRVLELDQLRGNLFQDFLSTCGVENPNLYEIILGFNKSPDKNTLITILELKKRFKGNDDAKLIFQRLISAVRSYENQFTSKPDKINLIDEKIYNKILEKYFEGNRKVARYFFGREELFLEPYKRKEMTNLSVNDLKPEALLDLLAYIFEEEYAFERRI